MVVFSGWGQWNTCSVSCGGGGTQIRTRTCDQNCDNVPDSDLTETQSCNDHICPGKIYPKLKFCFENHDFFKINVSITEKIFIVLVILFTNKTISIPIPTLDGALNIVAIDVWVHLALFHSIGH